MTLRMADGLPEGLVTSTDAIRVDIERVDRVAVEDITQLWRVYSANRNLLSNDVGRRLENFFWRIWSNPEILDRIRGNQVATIFDFISEGRIIRNTPTSSPRSSRVLPSLASATAPSPPEDEERSTADEAGSTADEAASAGDDGGETRAGSGKGKEPGEAHRPPSIEEEQGRRRGSSRPPPILKKPGGDSSAYAAKTARILTPTWKSARRDPVAGDDDESPTGGSSSKPASSPRNQAAMSAPSNRPSARPEPEPGSLPAAQRDPPPESQRRNSNASTKPKKKAGFAATNKRRPAVMRRKPSQSSSSTTPKGASPHVPGPVDASPASPTAPPARPAIATEPSSGAPSPTAARTTSRPTSRSASPISAVPFHRPSRDHLPDRHAMPDPAAPQDWLVDRDFRTKFVDKVRGEHPFAHLMSKSASATGIASSFQAGGMMAFGPAYDAGRSTGKGKGRLVGGQDAEERPDNRRVARRPSQAVEDDPADGHLLPRTKSQLTMLLEKDRLSGGKEKGKGKR